MAMAGAWGACRGHIDSSMFDGVDPGAGPCGKWDQDSPFEGRGESTFAMAGVGAGDAEDSVEHPPVLKDKWALICIYDDIDPVQRHGYCIRRVFSLPRWTPRWLVGSSYCATEFSENTGRFIMCTERASKCNPSLKLSVAILE